MYRARVTRCVNFFPIFQIFPLISTTPRNLSYFTSEFHPCKRGNHCVAHVAGVLESGKDVTN